MIRILILDEKEWVDPNRSLDDAYHIYLNGVVRLCFVSSQFSSRMKSPIVADYCMCMDKRCSIQR